MNNKNVLILGSGHLAYRVRRLAMEKGYQTNSIGEEAFELQDRNASTFDKISSVIEDIDLQMVSMVYVLDDNDEFNLRVLIALISLHKDLNITVSLFNENIAPHLQSGHPNLRILNPAKIAAPFFVAAAKKPVGQHSGLSVIPPNTIKTQSDNLIKKLIAGFGLVIALATTYFHLAENLSILNSLYFVIVTVSTVGFGDINLLESSDLSKVFGIFLILVSTVFIWLIFSLTVDRVIKKRVQLSMGIKKYSYKNHIILCGLGRLGFFVAEELIKTEQKLVIIESDEDAVAINYFRNLGVDVYIGNGRLARVLQDVGAANAKALIALTSDDYANLEIGLNAKSFQSDITLILRIFDESMAKKIEQSLDIHLTLSMSALVEDTFLKTLE